MTAVSGDLWRRVDVSDWPVRSVEQTGSTRNLWLAEPGTDHEWLHKDTVIPANGLEQGEDWSELLSTQVAGLLGVPCAVTRMCSRYGRRGSISRSVRPSGYALNEGRVILEREDAPGYVPHEEGRPGVDPQRPEVKRPGHNLSNIKSALRDVQSPPGFLGPINCGGFDAFAGYTLLDALVANRDRHEQNWAVLTPPLTSSQEKLSPSYDHASSLGYNVPDETREALTRDRVRFERWATKGTAYRFEYTGKPPTLITLATEALHLPHLTCGRNLGAQVSSSSRRSSEVIADDSAAPSSTTRANRSRLRSCRATTFSSMVSRETIR